MTLTCPICGHDRNVSVYRASKQPVLLNKLFKSREQACDAASGTLEFHQCCQCTFVWNAQFNSALITYGPGYVNDQSNSLTFRRHLDRVRTQLTSLANRRDGCIVEIGCGQGDLLQSLCNATGRRGVGFDPVYATATPGHLSNVNIRAECFQPFSLNSSELFRDSLSLVYCRHVLEHIPDPCAMIREIASLLHSHREASLYLEVPTFDWIAGHGAFFDFFYEHCSLFSDASMYRMLESAGFQSISITPAFDGQYLSVKAAIDAELTTLESHSLSQHHLLRNREYESLAVAMVQMREHVQAHLRELMENGPVVIWGAGGKGVSLLNQLGITHEQIPFIVDINSDKQDRFVALTGQQVISPEGIVPHIGPLSSNTPTIVIMNPAYIDEIARTIDRLDITAHLEVIDQGSLLAVHC